jgi:antitoxin (DNA-binding transcriptional repressor) of toxin-antitoxin stability system
VNEPVVSVGVSEAKTQLSKLLRLVDSGQEVEIRRNRALIARLVRAESERPRRFGLDAGRFTVPDDFDAPLPAGTFLA